MFKQVVIASYLYVPRDEIRDIGDMEDQLTVFPKYGKDPVKLYNDSLHGWFGLPLYHYRNLDNIADKITDNRAVGAPITVEFMSKFREGQVEVIDKFSKYVASGKTGFILRACPGFGKTVVAADIISLLGRTALVIVPRSNLISQWVDRLCQHTSLLPSEIGTACGGKATWQGKKVVVGLVHTLALDRFGDAFKRYFGVVIYDEVDRSVPPQTFAPVVSMFPSKYRIGVSATMKRQDGMEVVFHKHVGQIFLQGVASNRMKPKILIHIFTGSSGPVFGKTAIRKRGQLISRLAANGERNALIARYAKSILISGRRLVILSDRIKQLIELKTILIANGWAKDRDVGFYVRTLPGRGELSEKERKRIANVCKVILGTYGLFALGTDIPDLAGLIYATPMSETEQSKGRIEREFKGKLQPVVVDIVDQFYDNAARWGYKREHQYVAEGLKIRKIRS